MLILLRTSIKYVPVTVECCVGALSLLTAFGIMACVKAYLSSVSRAERFCFTEGDAVGSVCVGRWVGGCCAHAYVCAHTWLLFGTISCAGSSFNFKAGWGLVRLVRWSLSLCVRAYSQLTAWGRSSFWGSIYFTATCALGRVRAHVSRPALLTWVEAASSATT